MNNEYEDYMYGMRNYNSMMGCGCGFDNMSMNPMMQPNCMNMMPMSCSGGLESMYPEIYKIVFPMVIKTCDSMRYMNMGNNFINSNMLDEMTENIYRSINVDELDGDVRDSEDSKDETRRPPRRNTLRDLIRILLIRELLRRGFNMQPRSYMMY